MTASKPEIVWIHPDAFTDEPAMYTTSRQKIGPGPEIQAIRLPDHESARAADKARIAELVEALESMTCAYRMAIQAGHARITALGGDCDSVDQMLADFPDYGRSVELYKSYRAALAQQGKEAEC